MPPDNHYEVPEEFASFIARYFGDRGGVWLERLPAILNWCAATWRLRIGAPRFVLSFNYVVPVTREDGTRAVLKVGVPDAECLGEIDALLFFDGDGIARLLEHNYERGAQLLERLEPGTMLMDLFPERDEAATEIAAGLMQRLWRPAPPTHRFATVRDWAERGMRDLRARFDGGTGPFPEQLVGRAERLFAELLATAGEPVVLHGDLHHYNILAAQREPWLAIDPKGVVGDPGYELGPFITNPNALRDLGYPRPLLRQRIDQLAERLGFERERVWAWATAFSVLSAWWAYDPDHDDWRYAIELGEALADIEP